MSYGHFSKQCVDLWKSSRFQVAHFYDSEKPCQRWMPANCPRGRLINILKTNGETNQFKGENKCHDFHLVVKLIYYKQVLHLLVIYI